MAKANHKLSRFAKRHYEAIAGAMQELKRYAINDDLAFAVVWFFF